MLGRDGKFKPGDGSLLQSLFAYVVYSLVTMYDRALYRTYHNWDDLWDMQYTVELNSRQSINSAQNYGFYAGGEYCLGLFSPQLIL